MKKLTPNRYFKRLYQLHVTLVFVQLLLMLIAYYMRNTWSVSPQYPGLEFFRYLVPLLAAVGLYEGNKLYRRRLKKARNHATLAKKLVAYRRAFLYRCLFWIVPSLLAIAAFYFTGTWLYLLLSGLIVVVFVAHRPEMDKIRRELEI
jgi:hypothetical protein